MSETCGHGKLTHHPSSPLAKPMPPRVTRFCPCSRAFRTFVMVAGWAVSRSDSGRPAVCSLNCSSAAGRTLRGSATSAASPATLCRRCRLTMNRSTSMRRWMRVDRGSLSRVPSPGSHRPRRAIRSEEVHEQAADRVAVQCGHRADPAARTLPGRSRPGYRQVLDSARFEATDEGLQTRARAVWTSVVIWRVRLSSAARSWPSAEQAAGTRGLRAAHFWRGSSPRGSSGSSWRSSVSLVQVAEVERMALRMSSASVTQVASLARMR